MTHTTYTTVHLRATEGTVLTEAADLPDSERTYVGELYARSDSPMASPAYWREVPEAEAEEAMAAHRALMEAERNNTHDYGTDPQ